MATGNFPDDGRSPIPAMITDSGDALGRERIVIPAAVRRPGRQP
jgi:hypothetical protein